MAGAGSTATTSSRHRLRTVTGARRGRLTTAATASRRPSRDERLPPRAPTRASGSRLPGRPVELDVRPVWEPRERSIGSPTARRSSTSGSSSTSTTQVRVAHRDERVAARRTGRRPGLVGHVERGAARVDLDLGRPVRARMSPFERVQVRRAHLASRPRRDPGAVAENSASLPSGLRMVTLCGRRGRVEDEDAVAAGAHVGVADPFNAGGGELERARPPARPPGRRCRFLPLLEAHARRIPGLDRAKVRRRRLFEPTASRLTPTTD